MESTFEPEIINGDVWYTRNVSFKTDWDIFWATVRIVLKREGISSESSATMEEFMGEGNRVNMIL